MIAAFTRFDLSSWFPRSQTLLALGLVVVVGVLLPVPGVAVMASALVTSVLVSAPFLADERGRLDTLYGTLPVSRRAVVIGRALSLFLCYVVATVLALIVTAVSSFINGEALAGDFLVIALSASFAFVGLSMAIQLPVLFRIGFSRGRLVAYAPAFVVAGVAWLAQALGISAGSANPFDDVPAALIAGAGLAIGIAGMTFAVIVASGLYRTREL